MNYWPAEPTGLAECTAPLIALVRDLAATGARTAREMYGARGWVVPSQHRSVARDRADRRRLHGACGRPAARGCAPICGTVTTMAATRRISQSIYPLLRGAALFFLDTLQLDPRNRASGHQSVDLARERATARASSICAGPAMDMQILRDLFDHTAAAAAILEPTGSLPPQLRAARARLAPDTDRRARPAAGMAGGLGCGGAGAAAPSRLASLRASTRAIRSTWTRRRSWRRRRGVRSKCAATRATGWATAWRINLWARLRDGDHAHAILKFLLGPERHLSEYVRRASAVPDRRQFRRRRRRSPRC